MGKSKKSGKLEIADKDIAFQNEEKGEEYVEHLAAIVEFSNDAIISKSLDGTIRSWNRGCEKMFGYTDKQAVGENISIIIPPEYISEENAILRQVCNNEIIKNFETIRVKKDGEQIPVAITFSSINDIAGAIIGISEIAHDISLWKKNEEQLIEAKNKIVIANGLYAFISQINQATTRCSDEQSVFKEACRIATETGKFKAAWIGLIDSRNTKISLVAGYGILDEDISRFTDVTYTIQGPQYYVVKTGTYYLCNDIQHDLELENWKPLAAKRGFGSVIVFPIKKSGIIIGTFNLYAKEINFFDKAEIDLLSEATNDISFAVQVFEKDKLRSVAESNLQAIFENTSEGFILADSNGIVKSFNTKSAQTIFLNTEKEIKIGSNINDFIHPSRKESYKGVLSKVLAGETMQYDYSFERKKGDTKWFSFTISPVYNKNKAGEIEGVCITIVDITQRKKGDEENSLLVSIINSTDDAIITKNLDAIITSWNQGAEKTFGYPANEIIGKPLSILFPSHLKDQESKILKKIKKGESVEHYETERVRKDGKIINVSLTISPIKDSLGNIVGASKISRDITRRKKAEEERNMFFDLSIDMMGITGNDGYFNRVNPSFEKTLGFTPAELYAKTFLEFVHPDDVPSTLPEVEKLAKGAPSISFTNRYRCKDGNYKWLEWRVEPVGKTRYCIARDITERKEAESRLQESENRFRSLIENSADMLTMLSPTGKTIYASPAVANNFGYTNEEMLNLNMADIVHPDDALIVQDFVMKVMNHPGLPMQCPLIRNIKKDGTYMWLEGTLTNFLETEGINAIVANFRDVTEHKSAEEQKKAAEFKYRQIVETAQEGIWILDENNLTTFANKKLGEILEYSSEEMMGKENFFFMDDAGKKLSLEALERRRKGIKENMDLPYITKSGKQIWTSVSASPLFDETGKYKGALGMVADITLRKEAERKLLESESFNKEVLSSLSSNIAVIDENGILIAVNKAWDDFAKANGVTSLERVSTGSNYFDVCKRATENGDNDAAQSLAGIQSVLKNETQKFEMEYACHAPGQQRWFILSAILFGSDAHKVVISHQNITIQKLGEQSLQQSQSNLKAIIENTDASIYSLNTELRYIAFNKLLHDNLHQLYGIDIKIGDHVYSFLEKLDTEEANRWEKIYSRALSGENVEFEGEISIGEYHNYLSFTIYPIWENKIIIGLSCFVFDITPQKLEQQQKEKMTADLIQRNRDLEQFTFIVSHNLRAPTANIIGFAENLQDETITSQEQKEILQELSTSVTGLDTIIKDINTLLQIKREINEKKEIVIFSKLVKDIMISISNLLDKDRMLIKTDFSQVDEFYSLKAYIYSIFYNLISNSVKYSKPNEQSIIEITSKKENGKIILTFKDNGLGIDLKAKGDKIFGLYKRFHSHVEGKGMGLFMVKTQVESLGGSITINSEPNIGTEFTIVFENII